MTSGTSPTPPLVTHHEPVAEKEIDLDRLGTVAGLVSIAAVGISTLFQQLAVGTELYIVPAWLWWGIFAIFSGTMIAERWISSELTARAWLGGLCLGAAAVYLLAADWGFTGVCLVITAGVAPFVLGTKATFTLIATQSLVIATGQLVVGSPLPIVVTVAAVFGGFQLFAALMGIGALREGRAREALAEVNDELRAAQALLRESARAGERLRISRDLHDLVGHQLTALALELEVASHQATGAAAEHVGKARTIAKDLLTDLRKAVSQLRSTPSDVAAALTGAVTGVVRPKVHLEVDPDLVLTDPDQAHALVRCVQEIVTNTVRHAAAENLWIEVGRDDGGVTVRSRDDGRGTAAIRPGNGLTGMRERFEQVGGRLSYQSTPGHGFRLEASLPAS